MQEVATEVGRHGEFNFLLSNSAFLFAHCASRLIHRPPGAFASAHLKDRDISVDFRELTRPQATGSPSSPDHAADHGEAGRHPRQR